MNESMIVYFYCAHIPYEYRVYLVVTISMATTAASLLFYFNEFDDDKTNLIPILLLLVMLFKMYYFFGMSQNQVCADDKKL